MYHLVVPGSISPIAGKPIILKPQSGVHFLGVFWDVGWWPLPWREGGVEDVLTKGLRPRYAGARALILAAIIASATMREIAVASSLSRIIVGTSMGVEGVMCVMVAAETLMHRDRGALLAA